MTRFAPYELKAALASGLLSFPVTHATPDLEFDEPAYREHVAWQAEHGPAALFPAGGAGEFFALPPVDIPRVVRAAIAEAPTGMPVLAPAGFGTAHALELVRDAEAAGADGIFLCPPYLLELDAQALAAHVEAVCRETDLGVVVYHRGNAQFDAESVLGLTDRCPNFVGFKDGIGDLGLMVRLSATLGERLVYINGLPTAETYALPYLEAGSTTYSSAVFNFIPEWALDFYQAVRRRDRSAVEERLNEFILPYLRILNRRKGYAVSIVKAGMTVVGRPAGPVRPPLTELDATEMADLAEVVEKVTATNRLAPAST